MKASLKFLAVPLAVGALVFAGCGSDDSSDDSGSTDTSTTQSQSADSSGTSGSGKAQVVALAADPSGALAYDTTQLNATAGKVAVDFTNDSPIGHDVVIEDSGGNEVASTPVITGDEAVAEFDAKSGDYTFFCSLPGHEEAGMKGTLTVQ